MRAFSICVICCTALAFADKKSDTHFSTGPASSYPCKQTSDGITIAAVPYDTDELAHAAFGKMSPYQYGVLPVLVIIQNDTAHALRMDNIKVEYVGADGDRIDATPASDVKFIGQSPKRPAPNAGSPIPPGIFKHKNPLAEWEIEGRGFAARMLPPHEPASGFFYFQTRHLPGSRLYLTGLNEANTGKDVYYFEIPLDKSEH